MAYLDDSAWRYFWHPVAPCRSLPPPARKTGAPRSGHVRASRSQSARFGTVAPFPTVLHRSTRLSVAS